MVCGILHVHLWWGNQDCSEKSNCKPATTALTVQCHSCFGPRKLCTYTMFELTAPNSNLVLQCHRLQWGFQKLRCQVSPVPYHSSG